MLKQAVRRTYSNGYASKSWEANYYLTNSVSVLNQLQNLANITILTHVIPNFLYWNVQQMLQNYPSSESHQLPSLKPKSLTSNYVTVQDLRPLHHTHNFQHLTYVLKFYVYLVFPQVRSTYPNVLHY
jgi:hypothetical protein